MSKALLKSTAVVSAMTLLSRILGLVRDMVYAQALGAGAATDAFFVAFRIPNFFRRLFGEGAFSQAFVPVFAEYQQQRTPEALRALIAEVLGTLGAILSAITALGMLAAPLLVWLFAPGFAHDADKFALTGELMRITFPYLLFVCLTACVGGILNSCGQFAAPAFTPVLLNLCMIVAALWIAPLLEQPVLALAWGVAVAGLAQLVFLLPFLRKRGLLPRPRWAWRSEGVQRVIKLMIPTLFGTSVAQINLLINTLLASFLVSGSVTWIYYADRLMEFPQALLGVALGTVILPSLSRQHASADPHAFSATLDWALRLGLLIGIPASLALALLAEPLLATLFQYGAFSAFDTQMAAKSLATYSLGLLGFILVKILAPGYYARQDTRTPVKIGIKSMLVNIGCNLVLVWPLAHAGLTLSTSIAACVNAGLLWYGLQQAGVYQLAAGWKRFAGQLLAANLVMGLAVYWGAAQLNWLAAGVAQRAGYLTAIVVGAIVLYALVLLICGLRPRHLLLKRAG